MTVRPIFESSNTLHRKPRLGRIHGGRPVVDRLCGTEPMGRPSFDGVPVFLVEGLRKAAKDWSLLGVALDERELPPGEMPDSRSLALGVLTRPEVERTPVDELGKILSRWLYSLL